MRRKTLKVRVYRERELAWYPVLVVMQVSRAGFYKWLRRHKGITEREIRGNILTKRIKEIFDNHKKRYGAVRVRKELLKEGYSVSLKLVNKIMIENNLVCLHTTRFKVITTDSKHKLPVAENKLNREFNAAKPNQVWIADITYIRTVDGWVYLAAILDLFSKRVVGYQTSRRIDNELVLKALDKALRRFRPSEGLLFHSDQGVQFASHDFRDAIKRAKFTQSMSRKGNAWDNAPAESFFATLKKELSYPLGICIAFQVERELFEYIEAYYNTTRLHSSLGYLFKNEFERLKDAA